MLDFSFDRVGLLARVEAGLTSIQRAILWFGFTGGASILAALGITIFAIRTTQRMEGHSKELYRRASITEMAVELVHELRNPLMALRANVRDLLVSPELTREIVAELDREIVTLNDKLTGFLKLTRNHDDAFVPTDLEVLIRDAAQVSLLRVLEEGVVQRIGGERKVSVDVRVVAATHRPLMERGDPGLFRQDLLYRLLRSVFGISRAE